MRKRNAEWVPWYRERKYKGDLTEAEKRELDAFRMQPEHPATSFDDLPEEVQSYISGIELELYDKKQEGAAARAILYSAIGAGLLFLNYKSCFPAPDVWVDLGAVLLLGFTWFGYWRQWRRNAEEFVPTGHSWSPTEEGIRKEWELDYISHSRAKRSA
jgi:hypothetical protein